MKIVKAIFAVQSLVSFVAVAAVNDGAFFDLRTNPTEKLGGANRRKKLQHPKTARGGSTRGRMLKGAKMRLVCFFANETSPPVRRSFGSFSVAVDRK